MGFCEVNGHQLKYLFLQEEKRRKDVPLLVFLHEGLGSIAQWKDFPAEIAGKLDLPALVYDRYGHGGSDALKEKRSSHYLRHEGSVEFPALLQVLRIEEPLILIGHSDGGSIALVYAAQAPGRVRAVITEAAHVLIEEISREGIRDAVSLYKQGRLKELLLRYHGERTETMFYGWADTWLSEDMGSWNIKDLLTWITSPVLAIQGINDEYGSPEQLEWIVRYCHGITESFLVDDCEHIPHFQQREKVADKMTTFIKQHI